MHKKIIWKFILSYILIGVLGFIFLSTAVSSLIQNVIVSYESRSMYREASAIAGDSSLLSYRSSSADEDIKSDRMTDLYNNLCRLALYQESEIWLVSSGGVIYLNTSAPLEKESQTEIPGFDPVALGSGYFTIGRFFDHFTEEHLSVMVPIASNLNIHGYVAVHMPMTRIISLREQILGIVDIVCLVTYLVFLSFFVILCFSVLRPLKKITRGTQEFANGNLSYSIPLKSQDELGQLAASLNYMSGRLSQSEEYQRKFLANVSHDFRSPLTSIKGFIEAILDGTIPPELQNHYLEVVLGETNRLTKLTNGILTLNTMDRGSDMLKITDFDINSVIRDTAATFEGICRSRQITFNLLLTGSTLMVSADREKIQQVIYNLVDNAVKFSNDNSSIDISTDIKHDKIYVSVKDHGIGIPSASINKIWDRFYKADASRGREKKGNGLGLSIVREILTMHNQNITVISTEGAGTEFVFTLAPAQ